MPIVSNNTIYDSLVQGIGAAQTRLMAAQTVAASGLRVGAAADDPAAAARGSLIGSSLQQLDGMAVASRQAHAALGGADQALRQGAGLMARARELAVQGASAGLQADDRTALAAEAGALAAGMLALANARGDDGYLFAGNRQDQAPFAADGSYAGDAGVRRLEVAPGLQVDTQLAGDAVFGGAGGQGVLAALQGLQQALAANDPVAVQAALGPLQQGSTVLATAQAQLGAQQGALMAADRSRADTAVLLQGALSDTVQADTQTAFSEMIQAQAAYQAAVAEATRILMGLQSSLTT